MEYPQHLLDHLTENPRIEEIHFNSKGEWVFRPNKEFLNTKTRSQVLGFKAESKTVIDKPEATETSKNSKKDS